MVPDRAVRTRGACRTRATLGALLALWAFRACVSGLALWSLRTDRALSSGCACRSSLTRGARRTRYALDTLGSLDTLWSRLTLRPGLTLRALGTNLTLRPWLALWAFWSDLALDALWTRGSCRTSGTYTSGQNDGLSIAT